MQNEMILRPNTRYGEMDRSKEEAFPNAFGPGFRSNDEHGSVPNGFFQNLFLKILWTSIELSILLFQGLLEVSLLK